MRHVILKKNNSETQSFDNPFRFGSLKSAVAEVLLHSVATGEIVSFQIGEGLERGTLTNSMRCYFSQVAIQLGVRYKIKSSDSEEAYTVLALSGRW